MTDCYVVCTYTMSVREETVCLQASGIKSFVLLAFQILLLNFSEVISEFSEYIMLSYDFAFFKQLLGFLMKSYRHIFQKRLQTHKVIRGNQFYIYMGNSPG